MVEDDEEVRRSSVEALREMGYEVLEAGDAMDGVRLIVDHGGDRPAVHRCRVAGWRERARSWQTLRAVRSRACACCSPPATRAMRSLHKGVLDHGVHFIAKPFSLTALAAKIREVLEAPATVATTQAAPSHE